MNGTILTYDSVSLNGNTITGKELWNTIPFALKLVEMLVGNEEADRIVTSICYNH